jgi:hypothetical protein
MLVISVAIPREYLQSLFPSRRFEFGTPRLDIGSLGA